MKSITVLLTFLIGFMPVLADQEPMMALPIENDLKPLVWENILAKATVLKQRQTKEKRFSYAMSAAQLASLVVIASWLFCTWPTEHVSVEIKDQNLKTPEGAKGFIFSNIMKGIFGAISFISVNLFVQIFERIGNLAKSGGTALATSVGIVHGKPVYKVEKYLEIVNELSDSIIANSKEYQTISNQQRPKHLSTIQTNIIILLDALEITLARMIIDVDMIRRQSHYLARAASDVIVEIFETTNQSVAIIRQRFEKQENITDVLEHWSFIIKKDGKRFKQYAGMTDTYEESR